MVTWPGFFSQQRFLTSASVYHMKAYKEEWVNSENYLGAWMTAECHILVSVDSEVNPFFLGGLYISMILIFYIRLGYPKEHLILNCMQYLHTSNVAFIYSIL